VVLGAVTLIPTTAHAAFSGVNGLVVFVGSANGESSDRSCPHGNDQLFALPVGASHPFQLTCTPRHDQHPFVSPDGSEVVFSSSGDGGVSQLITIPLPTTSHGHHDDPTLVSGSPDASDDYASWSPANDGTIVFQRTTPGSAPQLYSENVTSPSTASPLFPSPTGFSDTEPVFNPSNANLVAFVRQIAEHSHIFSYDLSSHVLTDLSAQGGGSTTGNDSKPDFAPGGPGQRIVFQSDRGCPFSQLFTMTVQGTDQVPVFGTSGHEESTGSAACSYEAGNPVYSPQGDALAFDRHNSSTEGDEHAFDTNIWGNDEALYKVSVDSSGSAVGNVTRVVRDDDNNNDNNRSGDDPNWGPSSPPTQTPEAPLPVVLPVIAAGAAGAVFAVRRRRARRGQVSSSAV
jgi:Tol biopolymer transport system component